MVLRVWKGGGQQGEGGGRVIDTFCPLTILSRSEIPSCKCYNMCYS